MKALQLEELEEYMRERRISFEHHEVASKWDERKQAQFTAVKRWFVTTG